jgi:diaminopimelate epimerase
MAFYKYHGTGNDFILFDNRDGHLRFTTAQVAFLCNRRFGIGADGLMLLENVDGFDFKMVYYNSDGNESSMCGNGGRCIVAFAKKLGIVTDKAYFVAIDGPHHATFNTDGTISLEMKDVAEISKYGGYTILNTGSPHYVLPVADVKHTDVFNEGRGIRNQPEFKAEGINVNFVQQLDNKISVRTYERGVEDETLSCGTGVTAAAIASTGAATGTFRVPILTPGGDLEVSFTKQTPGSATNVVLTGPAVFVFKGEVDL